MVDGADTRKSSPVVALGIRCQESRHIVRDSSVFIDVSPISTSAEDKSAQSCRHPSHSCLSQVRTTIIDTWCLLPIDPSTYEESKARENFPQPHSESTLFTYKCVPATTPATVAGPPSRCR